MPYDTNPLLALEPTHPCSANGEADSVERVFAREFLMDGDVETARALHNADVTRILGLDQKPVHVDGDNPQKDQYPRALSWPALIMGIFM